MLKFAPKNNKKVLLAQSKEKKIRVYKLMFTLPGRLTTKKINFNVWKYFSSFHLYYKSFSSFSKTRKSCLLSSKTRGYYRAFQLSRMMIRKYMEQGMFFGVKKSSW